MFLTLKLDVVNVTLALLEYTLFRMERLLFVIVITVPLDLACKNCSISTHSMNFICFMKMLRSL